VEIITPTLNNALAEQRNDLEAAVPVIENIHQLERYWDMLGYPAFDGSVYDIDLYPDYLGIS